MSKLDGPLSKVWSTLVNLSLASDCHARHLIPWLLSSGGRAAMTTLRRVSHLCDPVGREPPGTP